MPGEGPTGFTAKIKLKRKRLPSSPINIRVSATPEESAMGGTMGSSSPENAEKAAFRFPSSPKPKMEKTKTPRGARSGYR